MLQVPLGIILKDETKYDDMIDILEHIQQYVPVKHVQRELVVPVTGEVLHLEDQEFARTLVGGDQLTAARACGAQLFRSNSETNEHRLAGLLPVCEDWHAKQCLLQV